MNIYWKDRWAFHLRVQEHFRNPEYRNGKSKFFTTFHRQ